jgi:beta-lactamase class D
MRSDDIVGWLVGYLERGGHVYVYVLNIEMPDTDDLSAFLTLRYALVRTLLKEQGLM